MLAVPFHSIDPMLDELRPIFKTGMLVIDVIVPVTFSSKRWPWSRLQKESASEHAPGDPPAQARRVAA